MLFLFPRFSLCYLSSAFFSFSCACKDFFFMVIKNTWHFNHLKVCNSIVLSIFTLCNNRSLWNFCNSETLYPLNTNSSFLFLQPLATTFIFSMCIIWLFRYLIFVDSYCIYHLAWLILAGIMFIHVVARDISYLFWLHSIQLCPILCDPMDCKPPGSSVHGIFQARILEWVAISLSRGSSEPRYQTRVSCTTGQLFTDWAPRGVYSWTCIAHFLYPFIHCTLGFLLPFGYGLLWIMLQWTWICKFSLRPLLNSPDVYSELGLLG